MDADGRHRLGAHPYRTASAPSPSREPFATRLRKRLRRNRRWIVCTSYAGLISGGVWSALPQSDPAVGIVLWTALSLLVYAVLHAWWSWYVRNRLAWGRLRIRLARSCPVCGCPTAHEHGCKCSDCDDTALPTPFCYDIQRSRWER